MKHKPKFITFTGYDEFTDVSRMKELSKQYPIEWGILLSETKIENRYPKARDVLKLMEQGLRLSIHICGKAADRVLDEAPNTWSKFIMHNYRRAQINTTRKDFDLETLEQWGDRVGLASVILQCRGPFPHYDSTVQFLFDQSGGKGLVPKQWPKQQYHCPMVGYAGGINPDNVLETLDRIEATNYWIDMESGVRDSQDRFDLSKVESVCQKVYNE